MGYFALSPFENSNSGVVVGIEFDGKSTLYATNDGTIIFNFPLFICLSN